MEDWDKSRVTWRWKPCPYNWNKGVWLRIERSKEGYELVHPLDAIKFLEIC